MPYTGEGVLVGLALPALDDLGAIMIAPDCTGNNWSETRSLSDLLKLLDHIQTVYRIDPMRRLVTGYSMGGIGTWYLAANHPEYFSAAIVLSAAPPMNVLEVKWQVPLYIIHGRDDEIFPIQATEQAVQNLRNREVDVQYLEVEGTTHFETSRFIEPLRSTIPWVKRLWD